MSSPMSSGPNRTAHTATTMPPPKFRAMPLSSKRLLFGGVAVVGSIFGGFYYHLYRRQERKETIDGVHPAAISTWEYRLKQVNRAVPLARKNPVDSVTLPASRVESRAEPLPEKRYEHDRAHHVTRKTLLDQGVQVPLRDGYGAPAQPAPQRDRGDGLAYTKRTP